MANKNNKSAAQKAAEQAAAEQAPAQETKSPEVKMPTNVNPNVKGLTQGEKVAYLASLQTERAFMMNNNEKPSKVMIDGLTMLAQATIIDIGIGEIATGASAIGYISTINEKNYGFFRDMAAEMGVALPEFKALPAPTDDQLKKAGIAGALPGAKMIVVSKENVSKEAIEKKKKENKVVASAKTIDNPALIENEEQLKSSLTALIVKPITNGSDKPDARIQRTIQFYKGYLTIQANHAENKEEALKEVKEKSLTTLLNEIVEIIGTCPFSLKGVAGYLRKGTAETGLPISSFCLYRRTADKAKDGNIDEQYLANIVRTLIIWSCNSHIEVSKKTIADAKKQIKKNEEANKTADKVAVRINNAAIDNYKDMIAAANAVIEEMSTVIAATSNPPFDAVENLINDYKSENKESIPYQVSHRVVSDILKTYYPELKDKNLDEDTMLHNVQQYAGIIVNMFRDPLSKSILYSESNIVEMKEAEKKEEESSEESKN